MSGNSRGLDGSDELPRDCGVALLLIDMINDLEFDGGEALMKRALPMARWLATLPASPPRMCVLFTADDAYMRDYRVLVPADCTESETEADYDSAMHLMKRSVKADVTPSTQLDLEALKRAPE